MHIFALNCGSSSVKSAVIDTDRRSRLFGRRVEDLDGSNLSAAVAEVLQRLRDGTRKPPDAIVHRIVHGGERFLRATLIDDAVLGEIEQLSHLAPLHNPPALAAVRQARQAYPQTPHVAVFDTALSRDVAAACARVRVAAGSAPALGHSPLWFSRHQPCTRDARRREYLGTTPDKLRIVSCHLGNGASVDGDRAWTQRRHEHGHDAARRAGDGYARR